MRGAYSCGAQMSAIVPPTIAEDVDPKAPARSRATSTVSMLGALSARSANRMPA